MAKKKIVKKVPELKIVEKVILAESPEKLEMPKVDPSELPATEISPVELQDIPASTDELALEANIQEPNPEEKLEQPIILTNEEITKAYFEQGQLNKQLIEKQYIIEWKVFGKEYKGQYTYLQIDKELFIFGSSVNDVKYIPAKNVKEAYDKFIGKD